MAFSGVGTKQWNPKCMDPVMSTCILRSFNLEMAQRRDSRNKPIKHTNLEQRTIVYWQKAEALLNERTVSALDPSGLNQAKVCGKSCIREYFLTPEWSRSSKKD